jgi:biotin synthase
MLRAEFAEALKRADKSENLSREDLITLLCAGTDESEELFKLADQIRFKYMGNDVHFRGIIEFSNYCTRNCFYCGLRKDNQDLARYRMKEEEIIAGAREAARLGCRTIVLQSGEDSYYTAERLAGIVLNLKKELNLAITLSLGERSKKDYALLKEAGADRYLLKQETCAAGLFADLRPGTSLEGRIIRLKWLRELGYQVGSGNMVGLPGQTVETLADDIILMRDLEVEMAGIGPFIPNKQTPLGNAPGGTLAMTLKTLAVARLALPCVHLPATTSAASIHPLGRVKALKCGANVVMPNMTPQAYRDSYIIYPGKLGVTDTPSQSYSKAVEAVKDAGRNASESYGHSLRYNISNKF